MSARGAQIVRVGGFVGALALAVAAAALITSGAARDAGDIREIRLVARQMTFYLDGDDTPNPAVRLRAGERVRLVLRNEDVGMSHDVTIEGWTVGTRLLEGRGLDAVTFDVPALPGEHAYLCTPHSRTMRGTVIVE